MILDIFIKFIIQRYNYQTIIVVISGIKAPHEGRLVGPIEGMQTKCHMTRICVSLFLYILNTGCLVTNKYLCGIINQSNYIFNLIDIIISMKISALWLIKLS